MHDDPDLYGNVGGIFAGIVALLACIGGGIKWTLNWNDHRAQSRTAKLDAWQRELDLREQRLAEEREKFLSEVRGELEEVKTSNAQLHKEHAALLGGYQLIAAALRVLDPDNRALAMADELLRAAFQPDPVTPADMKATVLKVKRSDEQ